MPKKTPKEKRDVFIGFAFGGGIYCGFLSSALLGSVLPGLALGVLAAYLLVFKLLK